MTPNSTVASVSSVTLLRVKCSEDAWGIIHPNETGDALLELIRKRLFVEKHVGITETLVVAVFHLFETLHHAGEIAIPCQHDDGRVGSTTRYKRDIVVWPVVLLWDCVVCLLRGCLVRAEEARDGCGIAVCFMGYGKDEMETELEKGL